MGTSHLHDGDLPKMPFVCGFLHLFHNLDTKRSNGTDQQRKPKMMLQPYETFIKLSSYRRDRKRAQK